MALDEFDIIAKYFAAGELAFSGEHVELGIGDDCAIIDPGADERLALSMDMLVEGVHFLEGADPFLLGQRTLLVNLSDLAAMGASPLCFTLALSLPDADEAWLAQFSAGLTVVATNNRCPLVGGDMTASHPRRGGRTLCVQVHGTLPVGKGIRRSGARAGDLIYVTGSLGNAAAGLELLRDGKGVLNANAANELIAAFYQPASRVQAGVALRGLASAAIDLSDGLASDLGHILRASDVGARVEINSVPISIALSAYASRQRCVTLALTGGDDYELCFTVSEENESKMLASLGELGIRPHRIGQITGELGLQWCGDAEFADLDLQGYKHFKKEEQLVRNKNV